MVIFRRLLCMKTGNEGNFETIIMEEGIEVRQKHGKNPIKLWTVNGRREMFRKTRSIEKQYE